MSAAGKTSTLSLRISDDLRQRIDRASETMPYKPTLTAMVERGLEMALLELEEFAQRVREADRERNRP